VIKTTRTIFDAPIDPTTGKPRDISVNQRKFAIGIALPFNNPYGVFHQVYTNKDQVMSNLRNLLLTAKGERFFQPDFGTNIRKVLFENITSDSIFQDSLRTEISSAISTWLPYLTIDRLEVRINVDEDGLVTEPNHAVGIYLRVMITGTNIYLPIRIFISETANIRIIEEARN